MAICGIKDVAQSSMDVDVPQSSCRIFLDKEISVNFLENRLKIVPKSLFKCKSCNDVFINIRYFNRL